MNRFFSLFLKGKLEKAPTNKQLETLKKLGITKKANTLKEAKELIDNRIQELEANKHAENQGKKAEYLIKESEKPTEKQLELLKSFGTTKEVKTKEEARELINEVIRKGEEHKETLAQEQKYLNLVKDIKKSEKLNQMIANREDDRGLER